MSTSTNPSNQTLIIIKPDSYHIRRKILQKFYNKGYHVRQAFSVAVSSDLIHKHYEEHKARTDYEKLCATFIGKTVFVGIMGNPYFETQEELISAAREFIKTVIRPEYGKNVMENAIHASDSVESFEREYKLWWGCENMKTVTKLECGQ